MVGSISLTTLVGAGSNEQLLELPGITSFDRSSDVSSLRHVRVSILCDAETVLLLS